jgi:two-component system, NarL family, response regulator NreC
VVRLIGEGLTTKQIAKRLGIAFKTAACYRSRILSKLACRNSVQVLRAAIRMGLIQP